MYRFPSPILGTDKPLRVILPKLTMRELFQRLGFSYANYSEGWSYEAWTGWMNGIESRPGTPISAGDAGAMAVRKYGEDLKRLADS